MRGSKGECLRAAATGSGSSTRAGVWARAAATTPVALAELVTANEAGAPPRGAGHSGHVRVCSAAQQLIVEAWGEDGTTLQQSPAPAGNVERSSRPTRAMPHLWEPPPGIAVSFFVIVYRACEVRSQSS